MIASWSMEQRGRGGAARIAGPPSLCGAWGEPWGASNYGRDVALLATRSFARTLKAGTFNGVGNLANVYVEKATVDEGGRAVFENVVVGRDLPSGPVVLMANPA